MRIISVQPFTKSVLPGMCVTVSHEFEQNALGIVIEGLAIAADGKIVGNLISNLDLPSTNTEKQHSLREFRPQRLYETTGSKRSLEKEFYFSVERPILEHIENLRLRDAKKDVHLSFGFTVDYSLLNVSIGMYRLGQPNLQGDSPIMSSNQNSDRSNLNARILVNYPDDLLQSYRLQTRAPHTIKASDWIHDFAPVLGMGQFIIVEIPQPDVRVVDSPNPTPELSEFSEFLERLAKAHTILGQMDKDLQLGEWGDVVEKSRGFWELFTQESKQLNPQSFIKQLLAKTTGLDEDKSGNLVQGIGRLYGYANDLHHPVNATGVKKVFTGGKEDAYLVYSLAASVLNVLAKKTHRL